MQGVYIDMDAHLVLVYADTPDGNDYSVYLTHGETTDAVVVTTTTNECIVRLNEVDATHAGSYNGSDCIVFEDGRQWRRVEMSYTQFRLLTTRPYVPLSFMAVRILQDVINRMMTAMSAWRTGGH